MESSEQVLGIIKSLKAEDFLDYNLVLTTRRIVLVHARDLSFPEPGASREWIDWMEPQQLNVK